MQYESDYAHRKPVCDILLNGTAYAPSKRPVEAVDVSMRFGSMKKTFRVVGERHWKAKVFSPAPSRPEPFTRLPIHYGRAYGGVDVDAKNLESVASYAKNPVGIGYYPLTKGDALDGKELPNTEKVGQPIDSPTGEYEPMSFGPAARNFECRIAYAGTYDTAWLETRAPFFPENFDYRYFQSSPPDQQVPYPRGGELVVLENLTPDGYTEFRLPQLELPVLFVFSRGNAVEQAAVVDTVVIEPDLARFMLTWRVALPLRRDCFEVRQVAVGMTLAEYRKEQRPPTKRHYSNLDEFIRAKRRRRTQV